MMNKQLMIFFRRFTCFSFFICPGMMCSLAQSQGGESDPVKEIRLDLDNAKGGVMSDFFSQVRYIPLESTKKSIFGRVTQMEITDDYFIILDDDTNCILLFNRDGKFHCKIKGGGGYRDPRKMIVSFTVNRFKKCIVFKNSEQDVYHSYDFDGKKISDVDFQKFGYWNSIQYIGSENFVADNGYGKRDAGKKTNFITFVKELNQPYLNFLPRSKVDYLGGDVFGVDGGPFYYSGGKGPLLYTKSYDYTIYKIADSSVAPWCKFIFPASHAIPADFFSNELYKGKKIKYFQDNGQMIYLLSNCFYIRNSLFFKANSTGSGLKKNYLLNLNSGKLICLDRVRTDKMASFIPLVNGDSFSQYGFMACDGSSVYSTISSVNLLDYIKKNSQDNPVLADSMKKMFKNINGQQNPIIRIMDTNDNF